MLRSRVTFVMIPCFGNLAKGRVSRGSGKGWPGGDLPGEVGRWGGGEMGRWGGGEVGRWGEYSRQLEIAIASGDSQEIFRDL
jgi:hypothetical protein